MRGEEGEVRILFCQGSRASARATVLVEGRASAFIDRQKGSKVFFVLLVPRKKVRRAIPVRQIDTIAFLG